jgi:hypothetical protein
MWLIRDRANWHSVNALDFIRDVPCSNPTWHMCYPECCLRVSQSLLENAGEVPRLGQDRFLPNSFQFISHPVVQCQLLNASLN